MKNALIVVLMIVSIHVFAESFTPAMAEWAKVFANIQLVEVDESRFDELILPKMSIANSVANLKYNYFWCSDGSPNLYLLAYGQGLSYSTGSLGNEVKRDIDVSTWLVSGSSQYGQDIKKVETYALLKPKQSVSSCKWFTGEFVVDNGAKFPLFIYEDSTSIMRSPEQIQKWVHTHRVGKPFLVPIDVNTDIPCKACTRGWLVTKGKDTFERRSICPICLGKLKYKGVMPTFYKVKVNYKTTWTPAQETNTISIPPKNTSDSPWGTR